MVTIVPSRPDNRDALLQLMYGYFTFYRQEPKDDKIKALIDDLRDSGSHNKQFLAYDDGKYVGFVTLYETYSTLSCTKIIVMNDLFVVPEVRGKGIGKVLFNYAKRYTKDLGYPKMEWVTETTNSRAQKFYDDLGGSSAVWKFYSISTNDHQES